MRWKPGRLRRMDQSRSSRPDGPDSSTAEGATGPDDRANRDLGSQPGGLPQGDAGFLPEDPRWDERDSEGGGESREDTGVEDGEAEIEPSVTDSQAEPSAEEIAAYYLEQLQRLKAEFDNYRKRVAREKEEWFLTARSEVVRQLLPILDDLRRARQHWPQQEAAPEAKGLLLIMKRFEDVLAQMGLEEQEAQSGAEFDPEQHEAVITAPSSEIVEGRILRTVEPGYFFRGRMLRPIKVSVSSGPPPE
jgi:molecular chaperone GrpE